MLILQLIQNIETNKKIFLYFCFQLVDKLNTNTEMEEVMNDYNMVRKMYNYKQQMYVNYSPK